MKKKAISIIFICIALLCACAAPLPEPKKMQPDEEAFARAMDFFNKKNYFEAIPAFEEMRGKFPLSPYAVLAEIRLGESHLSKLEYVEAVHFFENFRRLHPSNQHVPYSIFMAGLCHYKQMLPPDRDQTYAQEALEQFQLLVDLYPQSPYTGKALCKITEAKQKIVEHEFFVGSFYLKKKDYPGAVKRFNKILKIYPHAQEKDKLFFHLAEATLLAGDKNRGNKILIYLLKKYPESKYAQQAKARLDLVPSAEN
jgi:outer membrane protein assembly factor BamD